MTDLALDVLSLIRTRADLHRWHAANAHGQQMHEAVLLLREAVDREAPATVLTVAEKAIASGCRVLLRADDSSGIIGDAISELLALHAQAAALAKPTAAKLVTWMIRFQFENEADYFTIDPVTYAPALGADGMALYRTRLTEIRTRLGPEPPQAQRWSSPDSHQRFVLEWNDRRLAVHDRDVAAIIRTHARDRKVAAWLHETAEALAEIDQILLALEWAEQATKFDQGHQSAKAGEYWCALLAEHRPGDLLPARAEVFDRWPNAGTAARLRDAAGPDWPQHRDHVLTRLATRPRDAVWFALTDLDEVELAWQLAHSLGLRDTDTDIWDPLITAYQQRDPDAVIPVLAALVDADLRNTGAQYYRSAARHLTTMRRLATDTHRATEIDNLITGLRDTHRRRPRLQQEFDRAGLP